MNQYTKIAILTALAITLSVSVTMRAQSVKAFPGFPCDACAKDFAPGQEAKNSDQSANTFAPGQEKNSIHPVTCSQCNSASQFAPGQEKKRGTTITGP